MVAGSPRSKPPKYFPPHIWLESQRGIHSYVTCWSYVEGNPSPCQSIADILQGSQWPQSRPHWFHWKRLRLWLFEFCLGISPTNDVVSSPYWLHAVLWSPNNPIVLDEQQGTPILWQFLFIILFGPPFHQTVGNRFSHRWPFHTTGSTVLHDSSMFCFWYYWVAIHSSH